MIDKKREAEIRALIRTKRREWPRHEPHACVAELLDEIERLRYPNDLMEAAQNVCNRAQVFSSKGKTTGYVVSTDLMGDLRKAVVALKGKRPKCQTL